MAAAKTTEDLINLTDEKPKQNNKSKEKQINDFQLKMLEEFLHTAKELKTEKNNMATNENIQTNEINNITANRNVELSKFLDQYEQKNNTLNNNYNDITNNFNDILKLGTSKDNKNGSNISDKPLNFNDVFKINTKKTEPDISVENSKNCNIFDEILNNNSFRIHCRDEEMNINNNIAFFDETNSDFFFNNDKMLLKHNNFDNKATKVHENNQNFGDFDENELETTKYLTNIPKILTPSSKCIETSRISEEDEDLIDEIILNKNIESNYLKTAKMQENEPNPNENKDDFEVKGDFDKVFKKESLKKVNNVETKDLLDEIITKNNIKVFDFNQKIKNKTAEEREFIDELVTKRNITYLEPKKKVEKVFVKRSILKNENEKVLLTPGPSLHEKAVALPSIMERLKNKKAIEVQKKNEIKKYVLSSGNAGTSKHTTINSFSNAGPSKSATINSATSAGVSKIASIHSFSNAGISKNASIHSFTSACLPKSTYIISSASAGTKNNSTNAGLSKNTSINTSLAGVSNINSSVAGTSKNASINTPGTSKNPAVNILGPEFAYITPPEVLMADHNLNRLIESQTGKIFQNFVKTGQFFP